MSATLLCGDVREVLKTLPDNSVRCCVTSPPYWGLRDYGETGQIGLEHTPDAYVAELVAVFREVKRALAEDGTLWLNLGDSYAAARGGTTPPAQTVAGGVNGKGDTDAQRGMKQGYNPSRDAGSFGLKHKDLVGIPWMVAFALRADGWYLRRDIIWAKPNPMPESVRDRPTSSHEYIFLLSKNERYYYDADAIREPMKESSLRQLVSAEARQDAPPSNGTYKGGEGRGQSRGQHADHLVLGRKTDKQRGHSRKHAGFNDRWDAMTKEEQQAQGANSRSVWTIATQPYSGAHFATFPEELPRRCIKAGSAPGDTVLDPFGGSGTTAAVAVGLGRNAIHIDLNPKYIELARQRIGPMLCEDANG